jgi:hypothetical protein
MWLHLNHKVLQLCVKWKTDIQYSVTVWQIKTPDDGRFGAETCCERESEMKE